MDAESQATLELIVKLASLPFFLAVAVGLLTVWIVLRRLLNKEIRKLRSRPDHPRNRDDPSRGGS